MALMLCDSEFLVVETGQCLKWVEYHPEGLISFVNALAITPQQASMVCAGYASVVILSYLLKTARRSVK